MWPAWAEAYLRTEWHFDPLTVYVIACDLEKSLSFNKTFEITGYVHWPIYM